MRNWSEMGQNGRLSEYNTDRFKDQVTRLPKRMIVILFPSFIPLFHLLGSVFNTLHVVFMPRRRRRVCVRGQGRTSGGRMIALL